MRFLHLPIRPRLAGQLRAAFRAKKKRGLVTYDNVHAELMLHICSLVDEWADEIHEHDQNGLELGTAVMRPTKMQIAFADAHLAHQQKLLELTALFDGAVVRDGKFQDSFLYRVIFRGLTELGVRDLAEKVKMSDPLQCNSELDLADTPYLPVSPFCQIIRRRRACR